MFSNAHNAREVVTSVGNSWIICRSKSFAGRIYYFNTLTGEAVWNLSETEVERAKHTTRILQNQPGFALEDCPEPLESPTNYTTSEKQPFVNINQPSHCIVPPKVYDKQIINNCFPKSATLCTSHQYNRYNPTNPIPFKIPVAPALNPTAWNIASQQIFVTPMNGQPQPLISNNNLDHLYVNNMSNTLSDRFKRNSERSQKQPGAGYVSKNNIRYNKYKSPKKRYFKKFNNRNNKIDLRLLLSLKKRENLIKEKESRLMASEGVYSKYLDHGTQQDSVNPASIRRSYNFNVNDEEVEHVNNDYENWPENLNYKHSDLKQGSDSAHPSLIRRRRHTFSANAGEENEDNEWIQHLNSKHGDTNEDVNPHSPFNQKRSYGFSANEEGGNDVEDSYWDTYQGDVGRLPSRRRRSYSFSANEAENDYGENYCTSDEVVSIIPSRRRRRSHSFTANDDARNDEDNYWLSNQDDVSPLPSHSRSCSLNQHEKDNKGNDNIIWIKEKNLQEEHPLERKTLRNFLQTKESSDVLYIVPDSNVFLKNINLLNNVLLITEKKIRLLVPQMVMNKIVSQKFRSEALVEQALYFIWKQRAANLIIVVKNNEENERANSDILQFCSQIIQQNRRVFLLTDDVELYNIADASNIPVVTTAKLEQVVNEYKSNETTTKNTDVSKLANVKIIIPNDDETKKLPMSNYINRERGLKEERSANLLHVNNVVQIDKKACDVGVQADFVPVAKVIDDIWDDILLPDSIKANGYSPSNIGELHLRKYNLPRELSSKIKNTDGKKRTEEKRTWNKSKPKSTFSSSNDQNIKVGNSVASSSPATDSTINETASCNNENLTWGLSLHTSVESLYKNCVEGSRTGNNTYSNVNIMEENSNSIISNTASNVDTESEKSEKASKRKTAAEDRCVMFEVEDDRMEATLRTKAEEWVSRLEQIMEEALTQLLRREPGVALEAMPPPWTLHEAVECVKRHFQRDADVFHAADQLLQVSRDNGGLRGKIKPNISPHKYMELYSYAVYLIDALQGVLNCNEDLQTASTSMSKLYQDIQDPHLDPSNQDSFGGIDVHESEANVTAEKDNSKAKVNEGDKNKDIKKTSPKKNKEVQSPGKYNLRSKTKKNAEVNQETSDDVLLNRTIDSESSFFSSLYLKKISTSNSESETEKSQPLIGLETNSDDKQENSQSVQETDKHTDNTMEESTAQILKGDPIMNEPKIIRTFSKCLKIEEKLKNNKTALLGDSDVSWTYDDEETGLTIDEEQLASDYGYQDYMDNEYYANLNEGLWYTGNLPEENVLNSTLQVSKDINSPNKPVPLNLLMEKLESNILNAYTSIQNFCVRSSESLSSEELSADDLNRMQARAEKTSTYINKICDQLQSVLIRENSQNSIFYLLKNKEFAEISFEDGDMENYRQFISNCLEQGNILKESNELLIKACKLKAET